MIEKYKRIKALKKEIKRLNKLIDELIEERDGK
jgi:hypothetical protein